MIPSDIIDEIFNTSRIEEVVGEFVQLKKRGVNLLGLCPFHNEKTPSFTVSPAKGIYKCFGCSAGGNVVNFIMNHEHYNYPEALRYLAGKYGINIPEEELNQDQIDSRNEKESLYVVSQFASEYFQNTLKETDEGKSVGLGYFKSRQIDDKAIDKFQLGYCLQEGNIFTKEAKGSGYKLEFLEATGLTKSKNEFSYDGYKGRVIFPIHNLGGRVIGFGGRSLRSDNKSPKYINTPQCAIYDKSKVLYGLFHAKTAVLKNDCCYLCEGYTDVIALHQAGVENVVSSSGTSLTTDQVRLINRYTKNIVILYDGDKAGIKASLRGIDLLLSEGLNVKCVALPEGEDPDSYSRTFEQGGFANFLSENAQDFLMFKSKLLSEESKNDPISMAAVIHSVIESVSMIPDAVKRTLYIKECSKVMGMEEPVLMSSLNRFRHQQRKKSNGSTFQPDNQFDVPDSERYHNQQNEHIPDKKSEAETQEMDIIRILLKYGSKKILINVLNETNDETEISVSIAEYMISELLRDQVEMLNSDYQLLINLCAEKLEHDEHIDDRFFLQNENSKVAQIAVDMLSEKYVLHNWEKQEIPVGLEENNLRKAVAGAINSYRAKRVLQLISENQEEIKKTYDEGGDILPLMEKQKLLDGVKCELATSQTRVIVK